MYRFRWCSSETAGVHEDTGAARQADSGQSIYTETAGVSMDGYVRLRLTDCWAKFRLKHHLAS